MERTGGSGAQAGGGRLVAGVLAGVVMGVLISLGVIWYFNKMPMPFQDKGLHPGAASTGPDSAPAPLPAKPGDKPMEKPRFDFYRILPQGQAGTPVPAPASNPEDKPAAGAGLFYLQLGAFQKATDADNLKARLALMGVDVSVQDIDTNDKGVLHRVRSGPYDQPEDMNRVRNQLAQNGIQATVVKVKETPPAPVESKSAKQ